MSSRTLKNHEYLLVGKTTRTGLVLLKNCRREVDKHEGPESGKASQVGKELFKECQGHSVEMKIHTTRFAAIEIEPDDILFFRNGLLGFEDCRHWVLLADADNSSVAWLQSMQHADIALPVVSPRRFVSEYQVRLEPTDVDVLQLTSVEQAYVLGIVSRDEETLTLNLRAPLVINLDRRIGCQVVTVDPQPMQYELATLPVNLRRSA
jgi:flagellar assembly factor FliW